MKMVPDPVRVVVAVVTSRDASALTVTDTVVVPVAANWANRAGLVIRPAIKQIAVWIFISIPI